MTSATPPALPLTWSQRHPFMAMWLDLLMAALLLLGTVFLMSLFFALLQALRGGSGDVGEVFRVEASGLEMVLILASSFGMLLASLVTCMLRRPPTLAERIHARAALERPSTWLLATATGAGLFAASTTLLLLLQSLGKTLEPSNLAPLAALKAQSPALLWLLVVGVAPFAEELLFRRVLFGRLWAAGRPLAGMWTSSLIFALMHEIPGLGSSDWPQALLLFAFYTLMGMAFAWVYRRTGSLWAAVFAHALNNALACLLL